MTGLGVSEESVLDRYLRISGVLGPAVDGHHDPLACQSGGLTGLDADPGDAAVCWGEQVSRGLIHTQEKHKHTNSGQLTFSCVQQQRSWPQPGPETYRGPIITCSKKTNKQINKQKKLFQMKLIFFFF